MGVEFMRSEFRGQLSKPYSSYPNATKIVPTEMNDMNIEEESRFAFARLQQSYINAKLSISPDLH